MECGICRTQFKKEYFANDPFVNELFNNNHQNNRNIVILNQINTNINNGEIIYSHNRNNNIIITDINRIIFSRNNSINNSLRNGNRNNLRNSQNNTNSEYRIFYGLLILSFQPSKSFCLISFFLNIFFCGLGTILIGLNKKSMFYTLFGIIQCFCFFIFLVYGSLFNNQKKIFGKSPIVFFTKYFKLMALLFYISSIYISIFRNFLFFNLRKLNYNEKKERSLIIFFLNILIGGSGTLLVGIENFSEEGPIWNRINYVIYGIIQLLGYILTLYAISSIEDNNIKIDSGFLFVVCALCFFFSLHTSYKYYKKMTS